MLSLRDGVTITELTVLSVSEQSTMSRTLDQMESSGWIERRADRIDNRARRIFITPGGRALFETLWPVMATRAERTFDSVSAAERAASHPVLRKILHSIRQHEV